MRILVADDHAILRESLISSLSGEFPGAEFGEAGNYAGILSMIHENKWDLVILDINMPGRNGLEILKEIKEYDKDLPVVILSMYPEDQFAVRTIKAGASAYLTKETSVPELIRAIRTISDKHRYITSSVAELISDELSGDQNKSPFDSLSDREAQVFRMIAEGKTISEIGRLLSLSVKTISVYRSNILSKMDLRNNSEIILYAVRNHLLD